MLAKFSMAFHKLLLNGGLIFIAAIAVFTDGSSGEDFISDNPRLPDHVIPKHYDIKITPLIEQYDYHTLYEPYMSTVYETSICVLSGESDITIEILSPTRDIHLHIFKSQTDLMSIKLTDSSGVVHEQLKRYYYIDSQIVILDFVNELPIGQYILNMKFITFSPVDQINPLFRTSYKEEGRDKSWVLALGSQSIEARRLFPCWDEPKFWATFEISVKYYRDYTVSSNMPIQRIEVDQNNMKWTHFKSTFPISIQHVAITLTKFYSIDYIIRKVSTLSRQGVGKYLEFANTFAEGVMSLLESDWILMNRIPKVDQIAIPHYSSDSLSSFGIILYREDNIIYDEKLDSIAHKVDVARLIGYKMTYQLFGNIVSPSWWPYLWLNEGLSVLFGIDAVDKLFGQSRITDLLVVQNQYESFQLNSHFPMSQEEVTTPSEIESLFEFPRHSKAFSILRMLKYLITDEVFREGIYKYLDKHAFNVATSDDLWHAMQEPLGNSNNGFKPSIKKLMNTWLQRRHYPVLKITRNYDNGEWVNISITSSAKAGDSFVWIPLSYTTESYSNFDDTTLDKVVWLKCTPQYSSNIILPIRERNNWIMFNLKQSGYYRVSYDNRNLISIGTYLRTENYEDIHVLNRAKIIDDAFHFMVSGQLSSTIFWDLTSYLQQETDFVAWYPMFKAFEYMSTILPFPDKRVEEIKAKMHEMFEGLIRNIGLEDNKKDHFIDEYLVQEAAKWACLIRHPRCMVAASNKFYWFLRDFEKRKPLPLWREWTYCNGLRALQINWYKLKHNPVDTKFLGCSNDPTIVTQHLELIAKKEEDEYVVINGFHSIVARNARNDIVLEYMLSHFNEIKLRENSSVATLIDIINHVYTEEHLSKISKFAKDNMNDLFSSIQHKIDTRLTQIRKQMIHIQTYGSYTM